MGKIQVVIMEREPSDIAAFKRAEFFGYVLGNPSIRADGYSEESVLSKIKASLLIGRVGKAKVVEIDLASELLVQSVMED